MGQDTGYGAMPTIDPAPNGKVGSHVMTQIEQVIAAQSFLLGVCSQLEDPNIVVPAVKTLRDYALKGAALE